MHTRHAVLEGARTVSGVARGGTPRVSCQESSPTCPPVITRSAVDWAKRGVHVVQRQRRRIGLRTQPGLAAERLEAPRCACPAAVAAHFCSAVPSGVEARRSRRRRPESRRASGRRRSTSCPSAPAPARSRRWSTPAGGWPRSSFSIELGRRLGRLLGPDEPPARRVAGPAPSSNTSACAAASASSERGRRRIVVSTIENGAGSVAVSARPTLPNTVATSRKLADGSDRACGAARRRRPADTPGSVVGMKSRSPSSTRGRNSPPRRVRIGRQEATASAAVSSVSAGRARAKCTNGR